LFPFEVGGLSHVGELLPLLSCRAESNNLSGDLPEEICCLACLSSLDLSGNNLTSVPSCLPKMSLGLLDLSGNSGLSSTEGGSSRMR
jgi:Leucine-rich repeat (LRR) protein